MSTWPWLKLLSLQFTIRPADGLKAEQRIEVVMSDQNERTDVACQSGPNRERS